MKKFVRFLLVLIVVVVAILLVLAIYEPTDILVSRSTVIKAPKEAVFEQMVKFHNWPNWSPWNKMDPNMKMSYAGTDGEPGSGYHWIGDVKKTGEGEMKNIAVEGTTMKFDVTFSKPDHGTAHGTLKAEDTAGMTRATWSFAMHMPFPMNAMCAFVSMDKMLGGDFEDGLKNMKEYVESHAAMTPAIEIKEVDYPAHIFEGVRKTVAWSDLMKFFNDSYGMLSKDVAGKTSGPGVGLYFTWDTVAKQTDVAAAFPVADSSAPVKGYSFFHAGPAKAVMAVKKGPYSDMMTYHTAIQKYIAAHGMKQALVIEEYATGPVSEPDSTKWVTNIYYLLQ